MKPDWKDAPEWANLLALSKDGVWYWLENEPRNIDSVVFGRYKRCDMNNDIEFIQRRSIDDPEGKSIRVSKK